MFHKTATKVVTLILCVVMCLSVFPMSALAAIPNWENENVTYDKDTFGTNGYYNVISKKDYVLVPGAATETELVLNNATGDRRQVLHIIEVDPSNPDVSLVPGYYNIDKDITDVTNQQAAKLTDMAKYYEDVLGYNIVGGMNTDLYYAANAPRVLVYNGQDMRDYGATSSVLCVYKATDGTISVDVKAYSKATMDDELANGHATRGELLHAVGVSFGMTVKNGELVSKTEERTSAAAARSMVGVKADGTLVICMNDGRGANNSVGFNNYELGESMLALGCVWAANCDGGGSSTFVSKRVGEDELTMRSVPCDGAERPTIHGIFVASNVGPTGELDYAEIEAGYDYFAPGASYKFDAKGIDTNGYQMDIPATATWTLSDDTFGTISADGTFTSNGKAGDVDVQMVVGETVIGSKTIHVTNPSTLSLSATSTVLPYSTADKVRTITLPVVAKIGEADVYFDSNIFDITLSDATAGSLKGFEFTATTDESVTGVTVSAKYLPTGAVLTYTIEFGKGSEILWSFDNNIDGWLGNDKVNEWLTNAGVAAEDQLKNLISAGQISDDVYTSTFYATNDNGGKVHNGTGALGMQIDRTQCDYNNWTYALLFNVNEQIVLRDVANGKKATALGMWIYIPEDFHTDRNNASVAIQLTVYAGDSAETAKGDQIHFQYKGKNINGLTEDDIPENRWIYTTANISYKNYVALMEPTGTSYREPSFLRMYIKPSEAAKYSIYIDDITLDYSSAVDDREAPVISDVTYCVTDTNIALDGNTINSNVISFNANVADFVKNNAEGLDYTSAKVYIDGIAVTGVKASNGTMSVENVTLSNGAHKVTFVIADKLGNMAQVTKSFTVASDVAAPAIIFAGHNDKKIVPEYDSVYYLDLIAADIAKISGVTTEIELHTSSTWELDHMILAEGFSASYTYNEISKIATITITKTGTNKLTGEQTIASLPVRVWSWDSYTGTTGPVVDVEAKVVSGHITYADGKTGSFSGDIKVATKVDGNKSTNAWHKHDTELTILNQDATCTIPGYSNRTYCETCGSVVDWGTTISALEHDYVLGADDQFVCSVCDDVLVYSNGIFTASGKTYYAIAGKLMTGWQEYENAWYYFDSATRYAATGVAVVNGLTYTFDDNGALIKGAWVDDNGKLKYSYGPAFYAKGWQTIEGETYFFGTMVDGGYAYTGTRRVISNPNYPNGESFWYEFADDGRLIRKIDDTTFIIDGGYTYYLINGVFQKTGLTKVGDKYYYFSTTNGKMAVNVTRYVAYDCIHESASKFVAGTYTFTADGSMQVEEAKNGIIDGYYYIDGVMQKTGLTKVGDKYYYFSTTNGKMAKDITRYVAYDCIHESASSFAAGTYTFTADGSMYIKPVETEKNGIIDGYYYINGIMQKTGLTVVEGKVYYFSTTNGKMAKDITRAVAGDCIHESAAALGHKQGYYTFTADGSMYVEPVDEEKNGIIDGYYYINGIMQKTGLTKVGDDIYYFSTTNGKMAKDITRAVAGDCIHESAVAEGMKEGYYTFDTDGKMVKN